jgi:hypothetical protein
MSFLILDCDGRVIDTAETGMEAQEAKEWHSEETPWGRPYLIEEFVPGSEKRNGRDVDSGREHSSNASKSGGSE